MSSVTTRIKEIQQPRGGYIKPSSFTETKFNDGEILSEKENLSAALVGTVVDYMTRFIMTQNATEAFKVPIDGYQMKLTFLGNLLLEKLKDKTTADAIRLIVKNDGNNNIDILLKQITGLDDISITAACKAASYDIWRRNPMEAIMATGAADINPDSETIRNIRILVQRSVSFWEKVGPIVAEGFIFAESDKNGDLIKSGYTETVDSGDGDYLTSDTLWDFKVSKYAPNSKHTLQILMYYIMGKHSGIDIFKNIDKIGIFNPRLNIMYILNIENIPQDIIHVVETDVICY